MCAERPATSEPEDIMVNRIPRVLHVAAVEYTAQVLLAPQMAALQELGYDMRLACAPDGDEFSEQLQRFSPIEVAFPRSARPAAMATSIRQLRQAIAEARPDIVHLHTPAAALTSRLVPRSVLGPFPSLVYTVHGFAHTWDSWTIRSLLLERAERVLAPRADLLLFQSQEDLEEVRTRHYRTQTAYLGNGVQEHWFTGPLVRPPASRRQGLFVGRLIREKGVLDLLDALEEVPGVELVIAGTQLPTERDGVGDLVTKRAAEGQLAGRLTLLGMIDSATLKQHVHACGFLVLPSYREGVPRSIIEGMAAGRPAVVTDVRGCRELVTHGVNGFIVPPGEPRALARALEAMVSLPDAEYLAMSQAAYETVSSRFRESNVVTRLVEAYSSLGFPPPVSSTAAGTD